MKIEKLNENKIKITFNIDDLAEKNIDLYSFLHNSPETQNLFWDILNEAEKECGFNVDNSMIYVEVSTSGAGNFNLTVTKTNEKPNHLLGNVSTSSKKNIRLKRKTSYENIKTNYYQFACFDDICELAKNIPLEKIEESSLYEFNNSYYLKATSSYLPIISEYAALCPDSFHIEAKLNEYGKLMIEKQALPIIHKFFNKKRRN